MAQGLWFMVCDLWLMAQGLWLMAQGLRFMAQGLWFMAQGLWFSAHLQNVLSALCAIEQPFKLCDATLAQASLFKSGVRSVFPAFAPFVAEGSEPRQKP